MKKSVGGEHRICEFRRRKQLSQADLAERCGLSRQFVNLLESDRAQPNVQVALRLAEVLECSVEELFSLQAEDWVQRLQVHYTSGTPVEGGRVTLYRIRNRWVAHDADSMACSDSAIMESDGILEKGEGERVHCLSQKPRDEMQQNLLLASPDPVASLLSGRGGPGGGRCDWLSCSSERALKLLLAGSVHAACIQTLLRPERGEAPLAPKLPGVVRVAEWDAVYSLVESRGAMRSSQTGITVARLSQEATFEDYIRERLGQRRLDPSWVECKTPFDCARELVSGNAALAVAPSFLAQRMSLSSVATLRVRLSLLVQRECQAQEAVQHMLKRLESRPLLSDLAAVGGYSLRRLLT